MILALGLIGCGGSIPLDRGVRAGDRMRDPPPLAEVPVHGHRVTVEARLRDVTGELLAVDARSVWVLEGEDELARPVAVPIEDVRSVGIEVLDSGVAMAATWSAIGTVSTLSHGILLVFSAPVWAASGIGSSVYEGNANDIEVPRDRLDVLSQYARFPQGMPPGVLDRRRP